MNPGTQAGGWFAPVRRMALLGQDRGVRGQEHLRQVVEQAVKQRMQPSTAEEWQDLAEIVGQVLALVLEAAAKSPAGTLECPEAYAKTVASHEVSKYLAKKYPVRTRVATKLNYLVTKGIGFAIWKPAPSQQQQFGFEAWQKSTPKANKGRIAEFAQSPEACFQRLVGPHANWDVDLAENLAKLLDWLEGPVPFNLVVRAVQRASGLHEVSKVEIDEAVPLRSDVSVQNSVELKEYLRAMWECVTQLALAHRRALLLNLRDANGQGDVRLFPVLGVASKGDIAAALELTEESFGEWWDRLPLSDGEVADLMNVEATQVFGYRSSARRRLHQLLEKAGW